MSLSTKVFQDGVSKGRVMTQNLYYFEEDDFEEDETIQCEAFAAALDAVFSNSVRAYPSLESDAYGSLNGFI